MKNTIIIHPDTRTVLKMVADLVANRQDNRLWHLYRRAIKVGTTPNTLRSQLLIADNLIEYYNLLNERPYFHLDFPNDWSWLTYTLNIDISIIPIKEDKGVLVLSYGDTRNIIVPSKIPHLIQFINIQKTNNKLAFENHDHFGYHFHYCKIINDEPERTDLLLTFNPKDPYLPNVPLYSEKGHGSYRHKIQETKIGYNKRKKIYDACYDQLKGIGIEKFKTPKKESNIFYS